MFTTILALAATTIQGFCQEGNVELKDDLVPEAEQTLTKYIPMYDGTYLYKFYTMQPEEVEQQLAAYKAELHTKIDKQENPDEKVLAKKDVDYRVRKVLTQYNIMYGVDSLGIENLRKVMTDRRGDANYMALMMAASRKAYVKRMDSKQRAALAIRIYGDLELNNEAL